jgi:hypothetical protein
MITHVEALENRIASLERLVREQAKTINDLAQFVSEHQHESGREDSSCGCCPGTALHTDTAVVRVAGRWQSMDYERLSEE